MTDDRPVDGSQDATRTGGRVPRSSSRLPVSIGSYRILGKLGEGGMGIVYEAEQDHPKRRVALKIIRGGQVVDEERLRMFQREANTLARLKHPNIGAIYESGRTKDGQHFFAMELVRGQTLSSYLAGRPKLVTNEELRHRLHLFREVADAVHYAHQRGVIHRDLKPSNLIVTGMASAGGSGARLPEIKVLDFGLARITDTDVKATRTTELGVIKGTLPYMSPEQARGNPEEIDLRTDVYALGVVLYEMLAGRLPHELEAMPLLEAVRVICEEAPRPVAESWSGTDRLDADVTTIVARALEKEADRRYASAAALSEDVGRYLTSQPILARPPSAAYQLRKFAERNRALVGGIVATFLVLVAGVVTSTVLGLKESAQRRAAEQANRDLETVVEFQADMLGRVDPEEAGRLLFAQLREQVAEEQRQRGVPEQAVAATLASLTDVFGGVSATRVARSVLDDNVLKPAVETIDSEFDGRPLIEARLRSTLGKVYRGLGLYDPAEPLLTQAMKIRQELLGDDHPDTLDSIHSLASLYERQGRDDEAERLLLQTIEIRERLYVSDHSDTIGSKNDLATLYVSRGQYDKAEPLFLEARMTYQRVLGDDHPKTLVSMTNLAGLYSRQGRYAEAEPLSAEVVATHKRVMGDDHVNTLAAMHNLASLYRHQGRHEEAEDLFLETLADRVRVLGDDHPDTLTTMNALGRLYETQRRYAEAEPLLLESLETSRRVLGDDHPDTLTPMNTLAIMYKNQGHYSEAESLLLETLERSKRMMGEEHPNTLRVASNLAGLYYRQKRYDEVEPLLLEIVTIHKRLLGVDNPVTVKLMNNLASLYRRLGRHDESESLYIETLEARKRVLGDQHPDTLKSMNDLANLYRTTDRPDRARSLVTELLSHQRRAAEAEDSGASAKNAFAWSLLTCEPADLRDPATALTFALETNEMAEYKNPSYLDTLALAYHLAGDPAKAIESQNRAIALLPEGPSSQREDMEAALVKLEAARGQRDR